MMKYKNKKVIVDSIEFDSKKESQRYLELKRLESKGEITNLQVHPSWELIPSQKINGKVVERKCSYEADFSYYKDNELVVEDVKSKFTMKDKTFVIKKKLMLWIHNIEVKIVL